MKNIKHKTTLTLIILCMMMLSLGLIYAYKSNSLDIDAVKDFCAIYNIEIESNSEATFYKYGSDLDNRVVVKDSEMENCLAAGTPVTCAQSYCVQAYNKGQEVKIPMQLTQSSELIEYKQLITNVIDSTKNVSEIIE